MKNLSESDQALVSRYVDGELSARELVDFERRLLQEPLLRSAADAQRGVRGWFARTADDAGVEVPVGFADKVLQESRRLPSRESLQREAGVPGELEREEVTALRTGKGLLAAAVLVLGVSLLFANGLIRKPDTGQLEAVDQQRIEQIDQERERLKQQEARRR